MEVVKILSKESVFFDDAAKLFDEYRQFYKKPSDIKSAKEFLLKRINNDESDIFVAIKDNQTIGFMQLYRSFSSVNLSKIYILNDLYVNKNYRKVGAAKSLLNEAKKFAEKNGALRLTLSTEKTNNIAQNIYESEGYLKDNDFVCYNLQIATHK